MPHLLPVVRDFLDGRGPGVAAAGPMNAAQQALLTVLRKPPVPPAAQAMWYEGKVCEVIAHHFSSQSSRRNCFACGRNGCPGARRSGRDVASCESGRAADARRTGRKVGCSAFYLSRCFSQETGVTIPQYLRQIRIERAAELLLSGRFNVTEAALEVGYSSMSHFSRAFCETTGYCPALYTTMMAGRRK